MTFKEKEKAQEKDLSKDQESSFRHINLDTSEQSKWKYERQLRLLVWSSEQRSDMEYKFESHQTRWYLYYIRQKGSE